ncbi:hypothetical protein CCHL11_07682 [Colletotrichum chlorophyti]|uniref:GAR domain-containing protein n=1 Tax=Colletotrichum chlorophyti TaxID=708187 RepID=A0A1Q8RCT2_9PEZI|nr:hypothetical protein CCHL11_07682 [Colletotrichum chlorophyti]
MTDPPPITPGPAHQLRPPRPQYRLSDEHSPTRNRTNDDLLNRLTPMTGVEMLQSPSIELKQCLDNSTVTEQEFALRAAVASRKIYEWLEELSDWPWPASSGSAGFEMPDAKRRKLSDDTDVEYLGSLPAKDVTLYEQRVEGISHDMDELHIEDIKQHVMHTHIIPLSRPGTPISENRSITSLSYNRMDDLTALLTAIIIQALPNLSKLCRLLKVWHIRLSVLRRIPALLSGIAEAEFALTSAWNVLSSPTSTPAADGEIQDEVARLKQAFTVVKGVLEKQITKSGRSLDYMLDNLEGLQDTLPDDWLDRMEAVERNYAEWVASGEQRIREHEWAKAFGPSHPAKDTTLLSVVEDNPRPVTVPVPITVHPPEEDGTSDVSSRNETTPEQSDASGGEAMRSPGIQAHKRTTGLDGSDDVPKNTRNPLAEVHNESIKTSTSKGKKKAGASDNGPRKKPLFDEDEFEIEMSDDDIQLPPLIRGVRRESDASDSPTVINGHTSLLADASSDVEISASPPLPRQKRAETSTRKTAVDRFMNISPPSSPPLRPNVRQNNASPMTRPQEDGLLPALPLESSFNEDDYDQSFTSVGTPGSGNKSDEHLRQQISDILDSIPANIKLGKAPPKVDLNPPPLDLPGKRLRKPSRETIRRTGSSLSMASRTSSRAQTPYLTLAPAYAKNPRPRRPQSNQDIRVYHLSRSTGEAPIKLFIRCVGEHGERVMVRVGGGWADLGEYLKEYATHHGRRSTGTVETAKVEVQDAPRASSRAANSSPPSRPASALDMSPMTPLNVRKGRKSFGAGDLSSGPMLLPKTPAVPPIPDKFTPSSEDSNRSRSSSHISWEEEESSFLGLAGPTGRKVEMSEESRAWVESVKEKVRLASGEVRKTPEFGDMGKVGGTKRLFRKG